MKKWLILALLAPALATAQRYETSDGKICVAPVKMPYSGARNVPELSGGPDYLDEGGVVQLIEEAGGTVKPIPTVKLTEEENKDYGEWHRLGLANAHLGDIVAANEREGYLTVGLLANCSSLSGILGGLQSSGPSRRSRSASSSSTPMATSTPPRRRSPACSAVCPWRWPRACACGTCA